MTRVLVTGGSGFIAAHVIESLLKRGHSVVTTVRTKEKGEKILEAHPNAKENLSYVLVPDMSQAGAFDDAVVSSPALEAVIHTASPYHFQAKTEEAIKELITTAVNGTTGILKAVKAHAPTVNRVVVTSSFAAIVDPKKPLSYKYSESDWDPVTEEEARENPLTAYRASKTFAEKAAWDFVHAGEAQLPAHDMQSASGLGTDCTLPELSRELKHLESADPGPHHWSSSIKMPTNWQLPVG